MKQQLGSVVLGAAAMVVLVGCGASGSTPASSNPASTGSSGTASSPAAVGQSPAGEATVSPPGVPSLPPISASHADPGLEAQLPAEVSGIAMQRSSATFAALLASGADRAAIDAFLQSLGKTEADGTYAAAFDPTHTLAGGIFAFKISGADAAALLAGIIAIEKSDLGADATTQQASVGGKDVTVVTIGTGVNDTEWIFGRGDVVFVVNAPDEMHAAAFLQAIQ